jgi:MFS family permease
VPQGQARGPCHGQAGGSCHNPGVPSNSPDQEGGVLAPERRALTVGLILTVTLVAFEALAVGTVMPLVAGELHGLSLYGWVFSAFFLANLIGIVLAGSILDRGRLGASLLVGLGFFGVGLVIGGLAPSMEVLVVGRVLQGFGAGFEAPVAYTAIGRVYPDRTRPRMFATMSTAWVLPGIVGPAIAGIIGEQLGWRWVFLGLLPLIAVAAAMTVPPLQRVEREHPMAPHPVRPGEGLGRRLALATVAAAGAGLAVGGLGSATLVPGIPLVTAGIALGLPAFVRLVPPGTLHARPVLPAAILLRGLLTCGFFAADAYVPLALVAVRGTSAATAGIALTAATISWSVGSWAQERGVARFGVRRFVGAGFAALLVGIGLTALILLPGVPIPFGITGWGVAGFGMGLAYASLTLTVLRETESGGQGRASASLQLSDVLGTALGSGLGGALIAIAAGPAAIATGGGPVVAGSSGVMLPDAGPIATGIAMAFGVGALVAALGLALSGRLRHPSDGQAASRP